jgi:hypothetical protein
MPFIKSSSSSSDPVDIQNQVQEVRQRQAKMQQHQQQQLVQLRHQSRTQNLSSHNAQATQKLEVQRFPQVKVQIRHQRQRHEPLSTPTQAIPSSEPKTSYPIDHLLEDVLTKDQVLSLLTDSTQREAKLKQDLEDKERYIEQLEQIQHEAMWQAEQGAIERTAKEKNRMIEQMTRDHREEIRHLQDTCNERVKDVWTRYKQDVSFRYERDAILVSVHLKDKTAEGLGTCVYARRIPYAP